MNWAAFFGTIGGIGGGIIYIFGLFAIGSLAENAGYNGSRWETPLWVAGILALILPFAVVAGLTL
jgi:hypothetical protein